MGRTYIALFLCVCVRLSVSQQFSACPRGCPPSWVSLLKQFESSIGQLSVEKKVYKKYYYAHPNMPTFIELLNNENITSLTKLAIYSKNYETLLKPGHPICGAARNSGLLNTCTQSGFICQNSTRNIPEFICCPSQCLYTVGDCFYGQPANNLCVPTDIQSWQQVLMQAFMAG